MTPTSTQNLNAKLAPSRRHEGAGGSWVSRRATSTRSAGPSGRIAGAPRRYQGGYRVNV